MKVLYILQNLSADSGVTSIAMNIFRNTTKEKIQIDFLVCKRIVERETDFYNEIISNGGNVYYVGSPLEIKSFKKSLYNIKHFWRTYWTYNIWKYRLLSNVSSEWLGVFGGSLIKRINSGYKFINNFKKKAGV